MRVNDILNEAVKLGACEASGKATDWKSLSWLFFSPQGIESLKKNFPDFEQGDICIGTFGATTAKAVRDAGMRLDIEAPTPQMPSMTAALQQFLRKNVKPMPESEAV